MEHFLARMLRELAAHGERTAFVRDGERTSYAEALVLLRRLTAATAGFGDGDLVAVLGGNRPETVLAQLAVQLRGASVLLVPASASAPAREAALRDAGVTALLAEPGTPTPDDGGHPVTALRPSAVDGELPGPGTRSDTAHTLFASGGTTGTPKLVAHRGIYDGMAHIFAPDPHGPHRQLVVAPLSHLTGNAAVLGALLCGDTVVLHEGFDAAAVLRTVETEAITRLTLTPPRLAAVLDHPALPHTDVSSVRALSLGASPLPVARLRHALDVFGDAVRQGYGLTEAPMVASITAAEYTGHPERLGSVGRIVPGMEARIDAPDGESTGEVQVRGLALMAGYHAAPARTAAAMTDGWLRTGDVGRFDGDGYLYLDGRADDVIVTGEHGTNVHPAVVEDALTTHPRVRQAGVYAHDTGDGTALHAAVVADDAVAVETLRAHVRTTLGGEHFVPAHIELVRTLPLTPLGKLDRGALRTRDVRRSAR